ncbi:MAG: D-tyrosyl-tRNA(Tyr) deacylase [Phycisphaerae bacterium]|nr:D-tyrosyl-tRNA(Tyr) deacylase [Phycisphaerae bacterium]HOO17532.1 D-aminoacyl-tRNA deacylase [Phycisphaerae bacterium]HPC21874.1 D-aminoacyl-tRNA deacylase [Phycisphaerae bacterium]HRS27968.1 D-aminoacyl-tRNA deacylase [Phycisphaerae bacterium]
MRAVVQRVSQAGVTVAGEVVARIGPGLLVYAAAAPDDSADDVRYTAEKLAHLRIFPDEAGKMNLDVTQVKGDVLLVSAFTVYADARKGRRPSFDACARGEVAEPLVSALARALRGFGLTVESGRFGAHMLVESVNDGPICILLDSRRTF